MFGIIFGALVLGAAVVDGLVGVVSNHNAREHAKTLDENKSNIYVDRSGATRDIRTNIRVDLDPDVVELHGQDKCMRDYNGNILRNFTEEKREKRRIDAIKKGRTVYLYRERANGIYQGEEHREFGGDGYCEGTQFKDLATGEIYVARKIYIKEKRVFVPFYMNLNGMLVRTCDSYKLNSDLSQKEIRDFIVLFNNKQKANGWNNCKDKMFFKDRFGNITIRNPYTSKEYYCCENKITGDV